MCKMINDPNSNFNWKYKSEQPVLNSKIMNYFESTVLTKFLQKLGTTLNK